VAGLAGDNEHFAAERGRADHREPARPPGQRTRCARLAIRSNAVSVRRAQARPSSGPRPVTSAQRRSAVDRSPWETRSVRRPLRRGVAIRSGAINQKPRKEGRTDFRLLHRLHHSSSGALAGENGPATALCADVKPRISDCRPRHRFRTRNYPEIADRRAIFRHVGIVLRGLRFGRLSRLSADSLAVSSSSR